MKIPLKRISFFNGVPAGIGDMRGLGQVVTSEVADMHYDTALGLLGFKRRQAPGRPATELTHFHPGGIAMVFDETAIEKQTDKSKSRDAA
jgi:hypothetical protein